MTTISIDEYIKILELPKDFKELTKEKQNSVLKKCYHKQCLKYHPDINKTAEAHEICKRINEANSILLQAINDGSIKYRKTENKQEYKEEYSSANAEKDPLDEAIKEVFKEFEERERRKEQEQREEFINVLLGILLVVSVVLIGMVCVLGWELTVLIIANALCGAVGLLFKKSQSA